MARTEVLKMLSPSAINPGKLNAGGKAELTQADVAAMLTGAPRPVMLLAYAKEVQDKKSIIQLASHVYSWAVDIAVQEEWKIKRGQAIIRNVSHLAVAEAIAPNVCLVCYGNRHTGNKLCKNCNGSGHKYPTHKDRAVEIGIARSKYYDVWRDRYQCVYEYLQKLEYKLAVIIDKNSREKEPFSIDY